MAMNKFEVTQRPWSPTEIRQVVAEEVKSPLSEFVTKHTFNTVVTIALAAFAGVFATIAWLHS